MTAISKAWVTIADSAVDPDSPVDTTLMTGMRDSLVHLREWLGASFTGGAVQNHNHDGANSALVEVGGNLLRNGSFENGVSGSSDGWTVTNYTGGTNAVQTTGAMHGKYCLALTSTVLANGGAYATSNEFLPCAPARNYFAHALLKASVVNVSSKVEVIWYDSAQAQISISTLYTATNTPTTATPCGSGVVSPANTAYAKVRVTGGIPATGSATGSIYMDGVVFGAQDILNSFAIAGVKYRPAYRFLNLYDAPLDTYTTASASFVEVVNSLIRQSGVYRVHFEVYGSDGNGASTGRIYRNGVAYGTSRSGWTGGGGVFAAYDEDLYFEAGDTAQIFLQKSAGGTVAYRTFKFGTLSRVNEGYIDQIEVGAR